MAKASIYYDLLIKNERLVWVAEIGYQEAGIISIEQPTVSDRPEADSRYKNDKTH